MNGHDSFWTTLSDEELKSYQESLAYHYARPLLTTEQHERERRLRVARDVIGPRKKVYLDTKYWIYLRDAADGSPLRPIHAEILRQLEIKVQAGKAICPGSEATFLELM